MSNGTGLGSIELLAEVVCVEELEAEISTQRAPCLVHRGWLSDMTLIAAMIESKGGLERAVKDN